MTAPFNFVHRDGVLWVNAEADRGFRKALMDGVPVSLRSKMIEALAATPDGKARGHSFRYFGAEFNAVASAAADLANELHRFLESRGQPGFLDWVTVTRLGDDYRMLKVFYAWAQMKSVEPPKPGLNA